MLCDGVPLQSAYKTLQGVRWEICGGKEIKKKHLKLPILQKKELKLAFGIDMIIDHVTIILKTMYGEGVKRQK